MLDVPMRILALDLGAEWRGGQRQTHLVTSRLAARGHAVHLLARRGGPLESEAFRGNGLEVSGAPAGAEASPSLLLAVARAVRAFEPAVLYAGCGRSHGACVWSGASRGVPLVVHRRVAFPPGRDPLSRIKYRAPDRYLAVSGAVRDELLAVEVPAEKVVVLPDGLPDEAFVVKDPPPAPPFRLAHVGAFDGKKGQEIVVAVLARLLALGRDVTASFLGDGPARPAVAALARRLGVGERCSFAGMVDDVSERLAGCHILLLPSQSEGAPLAIAEALAAGCVVVAHDVGGSAELLDGGRAGRLVPDLDEKSWTAAIAELLDAPERRRELVAAGREAASRRTLARTVVSIERELASAAERA